MGLDSSLDPVMVGSAVYTQDGDRIGKVKEVRGAYFRVESPRQGTFWLARDTVRMATRRGVMLKLDNATLDGARVRLPDDLSGTQHSAPPPTP